MDSERLRALREALGLSQAQLARRLGVTQGTWNRWENGAAIGHPQILELALLRLLDMQRARISEEIAESVRALDPQGHGALVRRDDG